jgi:2-oxoglutarate ferredoxin oxidoreductase subunit delta
MGRNRVVVYPDWCKGCGLCAAFCPKKVFALGQDGKAHVVNEEACVNCGFCEPHCPDFAVLVIPAEAGQAPCPDAPNTAPDAQNAGKEEQP